MFLFSSCRIIDRTWLCAINFIVHSDKFILKHTSCTWSMSARSIPPHIESSHSQIISANLTVYHPNTFIHAYCVSFPPFSAVFSTGLVRFISVWISTWLCNPVTWNSPRWLTIFYHSVCNPSSHMELIEAAIFHCSGIDRSYILPLLYW